jgi:hypothetical protein
MKNNFKYISILLLAITLVACDENEIMPSFTTKGTATHTIATISASKTAPEPSETISLTLTYVNPSSDPLNEVTLRVKVGADDYVEIGKFAAGSEARDEILSKTVSYTAPATAATTIVFDMVITSQKEYPQILRATIKTK